MSQCLHQNKGALRGPFSQAEGDVRFVCKDCLSHLGWKKEDEKKTGEPKETLLTADRMLLTDLMTALDNVKLTGFEKDFIDSMREKVAKYKDNVRLSEKQEAILDRIQLKHVGKAKPKVKREPAVYSAKDIDGDIPF